MNTEKQIDAADAEANEVYREALELLNADGVPFLVGGAWALECLAGITRRTKDLDLFVRRGDCSRLLRVLAQAGYHTELRYPHWLCKALMRGHMIDVIFNTGNGEAPVDDLWLEKAL